MATKLYDRKADGPTYEGDAAAWALYQADLLRSGRLELLDREHLAEEIESLAKTEFRILTSALTIVLVHLVKWDFQPWERSRSWYHSIVEHRERIVRQLLENPSFKPRRQEALDRVWPHVVPQVLLQTYMDAREFPSDCPYDWDEIMNRAVIWPQP